MSKPVFLVGYRCTGKTTVARLLAEALGWRFVDADALLEERAGRTIREVFAEEGEAAFRALESGLLGELCRLERHVIATGGGVVLRPENRKQLRDSGAVIWLTADAETVWRRLQGDPTTADRRPALTVGGRAEVEELLKVRAPLYREVAHLVVDTGGRSPEDVVAVIVEALGLPPEAGR